MKTTRKCIIKRTIKDTIESITGKLFSFTYGDKASLSTASGNNCDASKLTIPIVYPTALAEPGAWPISALMGFLETGLVH